MIDVDALPDGPDGMFVRSKAILRIVQALTPEIDDQLAVLTDAVLLLVRDDPDAPALLCAVAEALRFAAKITAPDHRPVHVSTGGLPS